MKTLGPPSPKRRILFLALFAGLTLFVLRFLLFHPFSEKPLFRAWTENYDPYRYLEEFRYNEGTALLEKLSRLPTNYRLIIGGSHAERLIDPELLKREDLFYLQMSYFGVYQLLGLLEIEGFDQLEEIIYVHLPLDFISYGQAVKTELLPLPLDDVFFLYKNAFLHPDLNYRATKLLWKWLFRSLFVESRALGMYEAIHNHLYDRHQKIFLRKHLLYYNNEFRNLPSKDLFFLPKLTSSSDDSPAEGEDIRGTKDLSKNLKIIDWQMSAFERFLIKLDSSKKKFTLIISDIKRGCESSHYLKVKNYSEVKLKALQEKYQFDMLSTPDSDRISDSLYLDCEHFQSRFSREFKDLPANRYLKRAIEGTQ